MRSNARLGYAQARVQARFGARPADSFWRELEAGRTLPHLVELVRGSPLATAVESLPAAVDPHALEAQLRRRWVGVVDEISSWYPERVRPAFEWLAWLPWLAGLTWLAQGRPPVAWMRRDTLLGELAGMEAAERAPQLSEGPLEPFQPAFEAEPEAGVAHAWHAHWRQTWQALGADSRPGLDLLDAALATITRGADTDPRPEFDVLMDAVDASATRLFRRYAGTPVAGLAMLVLLRLDHMRLRAALASARLFGEARAA